MIVLFVSLGGSNGEFLPNLVGLTQDMAVALLSDSDILGSSSDVRSATPRRT
jgi:hypothetical protein